MEEKELNIFNNTPREVECIYQEREDGYFPNASKLKKGQRYHLTRIEVYAWKSYVYLKEFPNCNFNSVQFGEVAN